MFYSSSLNKWFGDNYNDLSPKFTHILHRLIKCSITFFSKRKLK